MFIVLDNRLKRPIIMGLLLALLLGAAIWYGVKPATLPQGFAKGNGRIEAVEIDVATKTPGRVLEILVDEGSFISAGQILARMDTAVLTAQLREAEAQFEQAKIGVDTAQSMVAQRLAEKEAAKAVVAQRQAEVDAASKRLARTEQLTAKGNASVQQLDDDRADTAGRKAAFSAAIAQVSAVEAALGAARAQVIAARSAVAASKATMERIQADIDDSALRSPRDGRVQYRVAQPGEVLSAGGAVLNLVDLSDVYMTFFLPTAEAGRVAIGAEAHIVLDAAPDYVIPAEISLVSDVAQFTPKTVETAEERQKLMFRLKARIDKTLLQQYLEQVKTGLPGMVYVKLDPDAEWPDELQIRLPK
jgi:HlyD family secretion protein|tara:strand:+ start:5962 stop:7041 length:1080 start_codon:yes stop_codon:yes gene_type:complete